MPANYTHWAKTAKEAIALLETGNVIECSLDHDLGLDCGTGYDVAKFIEQHAGTIPPIRCKVHSQNPVGVNNMKMALRNACKIWSVND